MLAPGRFWTEIDAGCAAGSRLDPLGGPRRLDLPETLGPPALSAAFLAPKVPLAGMRCAYPGRGCSPLQVRHRRSAVTAYQFWENCYTGLQPHFAAQRLTFIGSRRHRGTIRTVFGLAAQKPVLRSQPAKERLCNGLRPEPLTTFGWGPGRALSSLRLSLEDRTIWPTGTSGQSANRH